MNNQFFTDYIIHLADNSLVLGHRNSEWTGHGPVLEQDIALSNISLDLIGQSRNLYQYAAELLTKETGKYYDEDKLAFLRDAIDFKNCLLVEQPNGHWGTTVLRQFFFSAYQIELYGKLVKSSDETLSAIAEKSLKEVTYHVKWSSEWVIRLGDGTDESHGKMKESLSDLWRFTDEMFIPAAYEIPVTGNKTGFDPSLLKPAWDERIRKVLSEALLFQYLENIDSKSNPTGGKTGNHTEHLKHILSEMQYLQRTYPDCDW